MTRTDTPDERAGAAAWKDGARNAQGAWDGERQRETVEALDAVNVQDNGYDIPVAPHLFSPAAFGVTLSQPPYVWYALRMPMRFREFLHGYMLQLTIYARCGSV